MTAGEWDGDAIWDRIGGLIWTTRSCQGDVQLKARKSLDDIILRQKGAELRDINDNNGVLANGSNQ